jgi:hypothetical protein
VFGDSNLIVQQIKGDSQCLDGVLNSYRDKCLDIIKLFDTFSSSIFLRRRIVGRIG